MGQANRRGTFEQRKTASMVKQEEEINAITALKHSHWVIQSKAYDTMTWWQLDMSEEREAKIKKAKLKAQMDYAAVAGMMYGNSFDLLSKYFK
jgi:hypothetical protein